MTHVFLVVVRHLPSAVDGVLQEGHGAEVNLLEVHDAKILESLGVHDDLHQAFQVLMAQLSLVDELLGLHTGHVVLAGGAVQSQTQVVDELG